MCPRVCAMLGTFAFCLASGIGAAATPRTMRLDYFHTGGAACEIFAVDRVVVEPLPWPGNPQRPLDDTNLGKYLFEVVDLATNRVVYSRGFDSIYGEWETTADAKRVDGTYHESVRFPVPAQPVLLVIKKRDARNVFHEVWSTAVDAASKYVDTAMAPAPGTVITLLDSGEPAGKVDFLLLGEGYTAAQSGKCEADIRRLVDGVLTFSPFTERRADLNVRAICPAAPESGVSRPSAGIHRATLFGSTFDAFGTERYALSFDNRAIRTAASFAPYELLAIVMNESAYGNGGVFGQYASVSVDHPNAIAVFVHEFGHHVAGLGDEYYFNANVAYEAPRERVEPWEPNITALLDPARLKWRDLVAPETPLPTPWPKDDYERSIRESGETVRRMRAEGRSDEEIAELRRQARAATEAALDGGEHAAVVGAFVGALYQEQGYYRPQQRCLMINGHRYCAVCRRAIARVLDLYAVR
jgi:hypothetical protein